MDPNCIKAEVLAAHAEGRLPEAEQARVHTHLERCSSCLGQLSVLLGLLQVPDPEEADLPHLSAEARARAERLVRGARPTRRRSARPAPLWKAAIAAAASVLFVVVLVVFTRPPSTPEVTRRDAQRREAPPPREGTAATAPSPSVPPTQAHRRADPEPPRPAPAPKPPEVAERRPAPSPELEAKPPPVPVPPAEERRPTVAAGPVATLEQIRGEVRLAISGARVVAKLNHPILEGQSLETVGLSSQAVLRFADGTTLDLWGDTAVAEIAERRDERGKRVRLTRGLLQADVRPQPEGRPLVLATPAGEARVLGTKLRLGADETRTCLEVREGAVRLTRNDDGRAVDVEAGQYAVIASGTDFLAKPLPSRRLMPKLPYPGVDQARVDAAMDRAVEWLLQLLPLTPLDSQFGQFTYDELVLHALLFAGLDRRHPGFQVLLKGMLERKLERTYDVSLQAMILSELDPVRYQGRIAQCGQFLVDNQCDNGQWDYGNVSLFAEEHPSAARKDAPTPASRDLDPATPERGKPRARITLRRGRPHTASGDNSNSQYAALGLRACMDAEVVPPPATMAAALKAWERLQDADGGWAYQGYGSGPDEKTPYGSMTAGGLASVLLYRHALRLPWKTEIHVVKAQRWLGEHWSGVENPRLSNLPAGFQGSTQHYWLYALERSGVLSDVDTFGGRDWYREGSAMLLERQANEGYWRDTSGGRPISDTCFAILFLRRATMPILAGADRKK